MVLPQKASVVAPGALHHVIIRGIKHRKIFRSDYDHDNFVDRLSDLISETGTVCFALALISKPRPFIILKPVLPRFPYS